METTVKGPVGRGLPFMDDMVRAIHAGLKTETRRAMVSQPGVGESVDWLTNIVGRAPSFAVTRMMSSNIVREVRAPYPSPGGVVWLQENLRRDGSFAVYSPDGRLVRREENGALVEARWPWKNKTLPARYCPRWAWRTPVRATGLDAARLSGLTEEQAWAEGISVLHTREEVGAMGGAVACYLTLWDKINAQRGYPSSGDPWLWRLRFRSFTWDEVAMLPSWPSKDAVYLGPGRA